jgi:Ca-activated chloride channel family protein
VGWCGTEWAGSRGYAALTHYGTGHIARGLGGRPERRLENSAGTKFISTESIRKRKPFMEGKMKTGEHMRVWPVLGASLLLSALIGIGILAVQAQTDTQTNTQSTPSSARRIANPTIWPPRPVPPPRPELGRELQLISQTAQVSISGGVARTKLLQTFQNTANHTIEGVYVFPLPEGAAVSGFAMTVNGKRQEAEILDGDKAREIYTGIVQKMRDPAILEFIDRNLVRARIFPIAARAEQKIELEYSESLKAESGAYRFVVPLRLPTGGAAQKATVDVRIESNEGIRAVYSPTHDVEVKRDGDTARISGEWGSLQPRPIPATLRDETSTLNNRSGSDRDFVLYYTTARQRVGVNLVTHRGSDEDGYFMLLAAPDATVAPSEIAAKDVVFVFDTSGSMAGEKIEQARKALLNLLGNLNPNDRFNIVTFSSDVRTFREGLTPVSTQSVQAARAFTNEIKAVGGTNINDALTEAMKMFKASAVQDGRPHQLIFMTDGQPTVGETDVTEDPQERAR